ncbi:MAG: glycosyltransferase family 2 protein [Actinomycetota bacterium]|nr:glycosyltransferase family 2 protein [Actinomycetota bacterium]
MVTKLMREVAPAKPADPPLVSVVIPCLNEAENIVHCVETALHVLDENKIRGEVIVADNGSDDGSAELAQAAGATVVHEPRRGYGRAYLAGFAAARGDYIVMVDADLTYDFNEIPRFVKELDDGGELVMGNRMQNIQPGAMPWMNRYIGNPLLSGFLKLLFRTTIRDAHCGMRAVRRDVLPRLELRTAGMEFASEMVIRAARAELDVREFPIALHPRGGESKLNPFTDGWRHLRLMLLYNPDFLFLLPGLLVALAGTATMAAVLAHSSLFGHTFYVHTMIAGSLLVVVGTQLLGFGLCGRIYAVNHLGDRDPWLERRIARFRLEHGLLLGGGLTAAGTVLGGFIVAKWIAQGLGSLSEERVTILAATLVIVGIQVFFTSFLLSILSLRQPEQASKEL